MAYKDYIEDAKEYIKSQTQNSAYEEYYKKAIESLKKNSQISEDEINRKYADDQNALSAQNALNSKNISQYMASRGLARSGEAEEETIMNNISLNKSLSELAGERYSALAKLYAERDEAVMNLEKEYASKQADDETRLWQTALDIASAEKAIDERDEDQIREDKKTAEKREYEIYLKKLEAELEEEAKAKQREYERAKIEDERAYESKSAESGETEKGEYVPEQTAASLAKTLITTMTSNGKSVTKTSENAKIANYLENLKNEGISGEYIEKLKFSLSSYGYKQPSEADIRATTVTDESSDINDKIYDSYYSMYLTLGISKNSAVEKAHIAALYAQLDYCYRHVATKEEFETCLEILNVTTYQREQYYKRLESIAENPKAEDVVLGSEIESEE